MATHHYRSMVDVSNELHVSSDYDDCRRLSDGAPQPQRRLLPIPPTISAMHKNHHLSRSQILTPSRQHGVYSNSLLPDSQPQHNFQDQIQFQSAGLPAQPATRPSVLRANRNPLLSVASVDRTSATGLTPRILSPDVSLSRIRHETEYGRFNDTASDHPHSVPSRRRKFQHHSDHDDVSFGGRENYHDVGDYRGDCISNSLSPRDSQLPPRKYTAPPGLTAGIVRRGRPLSHQNQHLMPTSSIQRRFSENISRHHPETYHPSRSEFRPKAYSNAREDGHWNYHSGHEGFVDTPSKLVERLENMRRRAAGNGETQCMLCGSEFGLLGPRNYAAMCHDCRKYVCQKNCGVDTVDANRQMVFLCKICSEYREMWKKSNAWFYQGLPKYVLPNGSPGVNSNRRPTQDYNEDYDSRSRTPPAYSPSGSNRANSTWVHASPRREYNGDDDSEMGSARNSRAPSEHSLAYSDRYRIGGGRSHGRDSQSPTSSRHSTTASAYQRRRLPQVPNIDQTRNMKCASPQPRWALEHYNRSESYQSEAGSSSEDEDHRRDSSRGGTTSFRVGWSASTNKYRKQSVNSVGKPGNKVQRISLVGRTNRLVDESESENERESRSPTPPSSPRGSLQTPSSTHDHDIGNTITQPGESDSKSIDSGVVQSDHSQTNAYRNDTLCVASPGGPKLTASRDHLDHELTNERGADTDVTGQVVSNSCSSHAALGRHSPDVHSLTGEGAISRPHRAPSLTAVESPIPPVCVSPQPPRISEKSKLTSRLHKQLSKLSLHEGPKRDSSPDDIPSSPDDDLNSLGTIEFSLLYDDQQQNLTVNVKNAKNLRSMDANGFSDPYVKLHLLPGANKSTKLRSKTIPKNLNPEWDEKLTYYGVTEDDRLRKTLRITVMDQDRIGSDFLGETRVPLKKLSSGKERSFNVLLEKQLPVDNVDIGVERGKILLSMAYDTKKEILSVGIVRCAELPGLDPNGYSDPYVKLSLKPEKSKKHHAKTKTKKKTCNPEFLEEFGFSVTPNDLPKHWLELTVWDYDVGKHDDYVGGLLIGKNAKGEAARHWNACTSNPGKIVSRWHKLKPDRVDLDPAK